VLPDPHELEVVPRDKELPPDTLDANAESFFFTRLLPQMGQLTPSTESELRKSSSKVCSHSSHTNSKSGIGVSSESKNSIRELDAKPPRKLQLILKSGIF